MAELWMHLPINPEPWAVGPLGAARRGGKLSAYMGQNVQLHAYQEAVREELRYQWGELPMLTPPLAISVYFWRNRAEYTTDNQRQHRKHEADATNMLKAFEDAMQGIIFANDRDNVVVRAQTIDQGPEVVGQIVVSVYSDLDPMAMAQEAINAMPSGIHKKILTERVQPVPVEDDNVWPPRDGITR